MSEPIVGLPSVRVETNEDNLSQFAFGVVNYFTYTNHRGETTERKAVPLSLVYGKHSNFCPQSPDTGSGWMLVCLDLDKNAIRHFTLANIKVGS